MNDLVQEEGDERGEYKWMDGMVGVQLRAS